MSEPKEWACGEVTDATFGSWVEHPNRYWLAMNRCDRCGTRRIPHLLYDMWPRKELGLGHFWVVCTLCLIQWLGWRMEDQERRQEEMDVVNLGHFLELLERIPIELWPNDLKAAYEERKGALL